MSDHKNTPMVDSAGYRCLVACQSRLSTQCQHLTVNVSEVDGNIKTNDNWSMANVYTFRQVGYNYR